MVQFEELSSTTHGGASAEGCSKKDAGAKSCRYCGSDSKCWCPLCHDVFYCSPGCQKADWKQHKTTCSRKFEPKKSAPAKVENPCVKCGKEGKFNSGGNWFCTHDCLGSNLTDLTARVAHAANAKPESVQRMVEESSRIADFIKSASASKPNHNTSAETTENVKRLISASADKKEPFESEKTAESIKRMIERSEVKVAEIEQQNTSAENLKKSIGGDNHSSSRAGEEENLSRMIERDTDLMKTIRAAEEGKLDNMD
eukprot:TRINITY_DN63418_c0_g1_i1.p1 TRINITY_DN63418_c0_g1~~TRINITY_DN63418_c0_g1_i1.p1  ORF type:complete len:256 (-),score=50.57 TRINITY_DN63418_c0_g1_i1:102-869(-)